VQNGLVLGSDIFIHPADQPTYIGSVKWARPNGRNSVLFSVIVGSARFNDTRRVDHQDVFDLVVTHQIDARLAYTFESLYGCEARVTDFGFSNWLGVVQYLTYTCTPRLNATTRLEFFDDAQGERTDHRGLYTALTTGINFRPRKAIILRPELRYDYNGESRPFEGNHGLFTAAADLILRW
jgi:hypothetical protein